MTAVTTVPVYEPAPTPNAGNCGETIGLLSSGIYACRQVSMRQLPSPSAVAWLFDLGDTRGPWIVVLRDHEVEARERLGEHLVELGQADDIAQAMDLLADVTPEHAGVVW